MGALPTYKTTPIVWATDPPGLAQHVPRNTDISVTFDMPMDPATINGDNFSVTGQGGGRSGTVTYDLLTKTATFTPDELFDPSETVAVSISQNVSNLWGVHMSLVEGWTFQIESATEVVTPDPLGHPHQFALHQNYPNPFNAETIISFEVGKAARVELSVYNMVGQLVKILVKDHLPAGGHEIAWDGTDVSGRILGSGVYFYRLEAEGQNDVRRMVLVK